LSAPLLHVSDLRVSYGAINALSGVSFSIAAGEIVTLIGGNGAGKTTTLRALSGLVRASGAVEFDGQPLLGQPAHQIVARGMGHVPEGRMVFANLTVAENLAMGAYLDRNRDRVATNREEVFALFPRLRERLRQTAGTLSGGEQQMLAISRALMSRPRLLLLDEPSLGLAPQVIQLIFRILAEVHQKGVSILLVEQNAHLALNLAGHAYVLETGEVAMEGTGKALLSSEDVRRAYLGE
jgi:branched-chain amino acid transport system ATP-binding protein